MTTGNRPPDLAREIRELKSEIRKLWKALSDRPDPLPEQGQIPFSWAGDVDSWVESGPWAIVGPTTLTWVAIVCAYSGSYNTDVDLQVNGVVVRSFTLAAGEVRYVEQFAHQTTLGDAVNVVVDGGYCYGLTISVGYRRMVGP